MNISFKDKTALVTGAGKGIGRAIAVALYNGGAKVYALTRTQEDLDDLEKQCPGVQTCCCDVIDVDQTRAAINDIPQLDFLVNNAGVNTQQPFLEVTMEQYDWITGVNLKAPYYIGQAVANKMVKSGHGGSIVNISSIAAQAAIPDHTVYAASKAGLEQLTRNMALELGPHKIRVNAVAPTVVMTPLGRRNWGDPTVAAPMINHTPLGRFADEDEVAWAVMFLLSDKASMITGTVLPVDGGFGVM